MADVNFEANPAFVLQESDKGSVLKKGECLAKPITFPHKKEATDVNFEANPAMLRPTDKGSVIRVGQEISRPITFPNGRTPSEEASETEE